MMMTEITHLKQVWQVSNSSVMNYIGSYINNTSYIMYHTIIKTFVTVAYTIHLLQTTKIPKFPERTYDEYMKRRKIRELYENYF